MQAPSNVPEIIFWVGTGLGLAASGIGIAFKLVQGARENGARKSSNGSSSYTLLAVYEKMDDNKKEIIDELRRENMAAVDKLADVLQLGLSKIEAATRGQRGQP